MCKRLPYFGVSIVLFCLAGGSSAEIPAGAVAIYCFGSGELTDLSGNGNDATLGGGATIDGEGQLDFGTNGYLDISAVAGTLAGGSWTAYLKQLAPTAANGHWISVGQDSENNAFCMLQDVDGYQFWTDVWYQGGAGFNTTVGNFADGTPREVFVTYSGSFNIYVGATSVGSGGYSYSVPGSQAYIGDPPWGACGGEWGKPSLGGTVEAVGIFNRILSPTEMEELIDTICERCAASKPNPANRAVYVSPDADSNWTAGEGALSHDVYFGPDESAVSLGSSLAADFDGSGVIDMGDVAVVVLWWLQDPTGSQPAVDLFPDGNVNFADYALLAGDWKAESVFKGNQLETSYDPGRLELGLTYYWRIDEVNEADTRCPGKVWSFTVDDGKVRNPNPADGATNVGENITLSWTPGLLAASHDVYLGTDQSTVANATPGSSEYLGNVAGNSLPVSGLGLETYYFWRVDAVNSPAIWTGNVWSFDTRQSFGPVNVLVYYDPSRFAGWPANNGLLWNWGDELVVGFETGNFCCEGGHNICGDQRCVLARSLDAGMTWTMYDPPNFVGDGVGQKPRVQLNFTDPGFAMRVNGDEYFVSYDRCQSWQGPYPFGAFGEGTADSWERTSRTDYIVNDSDDCLVGMSVNQGEFGTDRAFCIRTTDGGLSWQFQGWIVAPSDPYRAVMPSTVRCSETKLVSALRRRNMGRDCDAWVDVYGSNDNGVSWAFLSRVGETGCENGNPPALARLSDGRLVCVYGNRSDGRMYIRYSDNEGQSWGPQGSLRDDWQDCMGDRQDLGYPRIAELDNGRIICVYYWSTGSHIENHIAATIWR